MAEKYLEAQYATGGYLDSDGQTDYSVVLRELMAQSAPAAQVQYYLNKRTEKALGNERLHQYAYDGVYQDATRYLSQKSSAAIGSDYAAQAADRKRRFERELADLEADYAARRGKVTQSAGEAAQEAYIAYMLDRRRMPQTLAGSGLTGGVAELQGRRLDAEYRRARESARTARDAALNELDTAAAKEMEKLTEKAQTELSAIEQAAQQAYLKYFGG